MSVDPVNLNEPERYYAFWNDIRTLAQWFGAVIVAELAALIVLLLRGR